MRPHQAGTASGQERQERLVEPGRDDLVRRQDDTAAAGERILGDEVDRRALQLGQVGVGVDGCGAPAASAVAVAEATRDVDDLGLEVRGLRRSRREDRDAARRAARAARSRSVAGIAPSSSPPTEMTRSEMSRR